MGGKEREREPPPATDDEDATQATTQEGDHAGRRRAGVIRQAQPTAQHHQITAGLASGAKRRAAAMSQGERAAKRMTDQRRRRHEQRGKSQPAPITFDAAVAKVASEAALGVAEVEDFRDWLLDPQQAGQPINGERITEWRASEAYERARLEYLDGCMCEGACTCTYDGVGIAPDVPGVTCDYFDEALLEPRDNDGQPSGGDWVPEGWDGVEADRHEERAKLERAKRIEREKQDDLAHASEKIWVQDSETGDWRLSTRGSIANFRNRRVQAYTGDAAEADAYLRDPGSEASQAWLEAQLAPGGGGPTPPGSPAYGDDCYFSHPDSPVRRPREEAPDDSDAYELDQERALELQGRISLFYGRPWDEVPRGATVPVTCEWTIASFSRQQQMQRPLSPAPVATDFDIEDKFLQERARWFRDHGGGGELDGSTRKQNEAFQRLKDRLFSLRRDRANPSGTPRASQRRASGAGSSTDPL